MDLFEVIVIDNKSTDNTKDVVNSFQGKIQNLKYIYEENIGLSKARNRGYLEARYDWVSYIDDDAKAYPNCVERALWVIKNYQFDCFGGRFLPWYLEPKPKWLPEDFGQFPLLIDRVGVLPDHQHGPGGVIVFRKSALPEVGGFPAELGMSGNQVGYGEENWVQDEMRKRGYTIGFDPDLKIDHLVAPYKFKLKWHFKRQFAKGKAGAIISGKRNNAFVSVFWALLVTAKEILKNIPKLFMRNYYYQNYLLDTFGFLVRELGANMK